MPRHMVEISREANAILDRLHRETRISKTHLVSSAVVNADSLGPDVTALMFDTVSGRVLERMLERLGDGKRCSS